LNIWVRGSGKSLDDPAAGRIVFGMQSALRAGLDLARIIGCFYSLK